MLEKDPVELAYEGIISRYGLYASQTDACIKKLSNCNIAERNHVIDAIVSDYKNECEYYLKHLNSMSTLEVEAFVWFIVMKLDLVRGLLPGAQAAPIPELNELLENFENAMWKKIDPYLFSENKPK